MAFVIPTRQKSDLLFESNVPLDFGGIFTSEVRRVSGYAKVKVLAIADQMFGMNVEEAVRVDLEGNGEFVQTDPTETAVLVGGVYVITTSFRPFGKFMKIVFGNLGLSSMTSFNLQCMGLPLP